MNIFEKMEELNGKAERERLAKERTIRDAEAGLREKEDDARRILDEAGRTLDKAVCDAETVYDAGTAPLYAEIMEIKWQHLDFAAGTAFTAPVPHQNRFRDRITDVPGGVLVTGTRTLKNHTEHDIVFRGGSLQQNAITDLIRRYPEKIRCPENIAQVFTEAGYRYKKTHAAAEKKHTAIVRDATDFLFRLRDILTEIPAPAPDLRLLVSGLWSGMNIRCTSPEAAILTIRNMELRLRISADRNLEIRDCPPEKEADTETEIRRWAAYPGHGFPIIITEIRFL